MSRICVVVLLSTICGVPGIGLAQPDLGGVTEVYTSAGISQPVSPTPFRDLWSTGNHMTAGVGFESSGIFVLRMGLRYNSFVLDTAAVASAGDLAADIELPIDNRYYLFGTTFDLLLDIPSPVERFSPYFLVGLSVYHTDLSDMSVSGGVSETDIQKRGGVAGGMNVGFGLSHMLSSDVETFLEYILVGGFAGGDKKVFTPLSLGLTVQI